MITHESIITGKKINKLLMTPQEKAIELIHFYTKELLSAKYSINGFVIEQLAKQCVKIAVDEILKLQLNDGYDHQFWQEVNQHIEQM